MREKTAAAVKVALVKWENAPAHIKIMGAAYVSPILEALVLINAELEEHRRRLDMEEDFFEEIGGNDGN